MKKQALCIGISSLFLGALLANSVAEQPQMTPQPVAKQALDKWIQFSVSQGYRRDKLTTSYAGKHHHPNIATKFNWKHIDIYQTRLGTRLFHNDYFADVNLGYGDIGHGRFTNNNYLRSHEKVEWARSTHPLNDSYAFDARFALGKYFELGDRFKIAPEIGYQWNYMHLKMEHGHFEKQVVDGEIVNSHKRVHNMHSSYSANFDAPFIGFETEAKLCSLVQLIGRYDFSFLLKDHSTAYWHKRKLHVSEHSRHEKGFGHDVAVGLNFAIAKNLNLKTEYEFSYKKAKDGHVYGRRHDDKGQLPLNKSRWTSSEARLSIEWAT